MLMASSSTPSQHLQLPHNTLVGPTASLSRQDLMARLEHFGMLFQSAQQPVTD